MNSRNNSCQPASCAPVHAQLDSCITRQVHGITMVMHCEIAWNCLTLPLQGWSVVQPIDEVQEAWENQGQMLAAVALSTVQHSWLLPCQRVSGKDKTPDHLPFGSSSFGMLAGNWRNWAVLFLNFLSLVPNLWRSLSSPHYARVCLNA